MKMLVVLWIGESRDVLRFKTLLCLSQVTLIARVEGEQASYFSRSRARMPIDLWCLGSVSSIKKASLLPATLSSFFAIALVPE
jgi:hypothetical protein